MVYLGLPINSMVIFHGELLVINRWYIYGTSVHIYIYVVYLYGISMMIQYIYMVYLLYLILWGVSSP